jgi:hypothetical protein
MLAVSPMDMLDFNQHDTTAIRVEEPRAPFGNTQHVAIKATLRHMAELKDAELNLVAAVARALARKGIYR